MDQKQINLQKFLSPRSIAFIGSEQFVRQGIQNCKRLGFTGKMFAVCRSVDNIDGLHCYHSLQELTEQIDAAYIAVRNTQTIEVVKELESRGVSGAVCYAAGFSEIGKEKLQDDLVKAAGDMAIVGPNCYGVLNFLDHVSMWPDRHGISNMDKGVAIISQSGNVSLNLTMNERSLPLAYSIDVGNQAVLEMADYINVLCEDSRVSAIGLHIEGLKNTSAFSEAAKKALEKGIPIVAFKTGVSEVGSKLTMSHTSSLAGSDQLYDALFNRLNICRVDSLHSFLETLKLFTVTGEISGRKLGVLTCSGGESTISADLAANYQFTLSPLREEQVKILESYLTEFEHVSNPLDYNTSIWGNESKLETCFQAFLNGDFDVSVLILDILEANNGNVQPWIAAINAITKVKRLANKKVVVASTLPEGIPQSIREKLIENGISPMQGVKEAFHALFLVQKYYWKLKMNTDDIPTQFFKVAPTDIRAAYTVTEWDGKQLLKSYGLSVPKGILVTKEEEIFLQGMKPPFVVKGVSNQLAHKTELQAVILDLKNKQDVMKAIDKVDQNISHLPEEGRYFLIEEMIQNPVAELNIGIKRDEQFGLVLIISMGGELVNLLNDSIPILLPTTKEEIRERLLQLKGIKLLQGFRGRKIGDVDAVIEAAEAIAYYAKENQDSILELDVNPLFVLPDGEGVIAVDAFIRMQAVQDVKIVL